jgi:hypothetical protein
VLEFFFQALREADPVGFWIGTLFAAGVGAYALRRGLRAFWQLRLIVDTPTARIRSAPQGYVELQGLALPHREPIAARLTGSPCVWYRYRIQERRRGGRNERWVTVEHGDAERPFLLDDGTGRCLVEAGGAEVRCRERQVWHSASRGGFGSAPDGLAALFSDGRRYRMTEERIRDGEQVYLLGRFETPRRGARERQRLTRELLAQWKRDPERMQAIDRNGDGEIDLGEWDAARARAERIATRAEDRLSREPPLPVVGATGDPRHPFVISTEGEQALAGRLRWSAFGGTLLGLALGVGAALALVARVSAPL